MAIPSFNEWKKTTNGTNTPAISPTTNKIPSFNEWSGTDTVKTNIPTKSFFQKYTDWSSNIGDKIGNIETSFAKNLWSIYEQTPEKIKEDIKAGAEDIQAGRPIKGIIKAGFRTAGDAANAIFAPLSAAIGTAIEETGGQNLMDKAGQVVADKSGITDKKWFQDFAISHPNAGEDFNRLLTLVMSKGEKGEINPKQMVKDIKTFADKIVTKKPTAILEDFAAKLEKAKQNTINPIEKPITPEITKVQEIAKQFETPMEKPVVSTEPRPTKIATETALDRANTERDLVREKSDFIKSKVGEPKSYSEKDIADYNQKIIKATKEFELSKEENIIKEVPTVKVPGSQLPVGEGQLKVSRLEARIKDKLNKVTPEQAEKEGLSTYKQMNKKENITKAADFVTKDPEGALKVLKGEIDAPEGLTHGAIGIAAEASAEMAGNANLISKLASLRATRYGQEISILTEADPFSITNQVSKIKIAREEAVQKVLGKRKTATKAKDDIIKKGKKEVKSTRMKIEDAQKLLDSLVC